MGHGPNSSKIVVLFYVLFYALFVCKCVLPPGDNPVAVNKYIISYIFAIIDSFVVTAEDHEVDSRRFFIDFQPHYGTGIDAASNRNEHQGYFLGGKDDHCMGLTILPPSCADYLEILGVSASMEP